MRRRRRTEVTVETRRVLILRRRARTALNWCPACRAQVAMLNAEEAAMLAGTDTRAIYRWAEGGRVHSAETSGRSLLICADSLLAARASPPAGEE